MNAVVRKKLERLAAGGAPRVLDLFAGCGGISLGFQRAGLEIAAAIEMDEQAARSHAHNFHGGDARHARARDILKTEPEDLAHELKLGSAQQAFDLIVGGPPCQAFARVGRAKLREIADHPEAFRRDARANLYMRYLHYVASVKPLGLLIENVPDFLNFGGVNIAHDICEALDELGYVARYTLTSAARHGVPQFRDRVFLVAWRRELGITPSFPRPDHEVTLPVGYGGTRGFALKGVDLFRGDYFQPEPSVGQALADAVTAEQALGDLSPITGHLDGTMKRGARRFDTLARYASRRPSSYAADMRSWPGFVNRDGVYDHVIRLLPRDTAIFRAMQHGDEYPAAPAPAIRLFDRVVIRVERIEGPLS
jgi:DNA (cytosine-5)-methyltransferase 1